jgi:hypothetical protein
MLSSPIQSNGKAGVCSVSTVLSPREVDSQAGFCPIWSVPLQSLGTVVHGVLVRLFAQLVSGQMMPLAVGGGCGGMGVSCQVMKFCDSIVRALWH